MKTYTPLTATRPYEKLCIRPISCRLGCEAAGTDFTVCAIQPFVQTLESFATTHPAPRSRLPIETVNVFDGLLVTAPDQPVELTESAVL